MSNRFFEELKSGRKQVYEHVAAKALAWKTGLVVGATSDAIKKIVRETGNRVPLLVPGIGAQGGDLKMVMDAVKGNAAIHRVNASSSIAYAFEKSGKDAAGAALDEAQKLNAVIRKRL